jgi:hypothetical protein
VYLPDHHSIDRLRGNPAARHAALIPKRPWF